VSAQPREVKLGGDTFFVVPLKAGPAFDLEPLIFPIAAQLAAILKLSTKIETAADLLALDVDPDEIVRVAVGVCRQLPPDVMQTLRCGLLADSTCNNLALFGPDGCFDQKMRGRSLDTWRLLWEALKANYPDFFGLLGRAGKAEQPASPSAASSG